VSSDTETPAFWGNMFPPYFLFRSEDVIGNSGSRTGETIIDFLTANIRLSRLLELIEQHTGKP